MTEAIVQNTVVAISCSLERLNRSSKNMVGQAILQNRKGVSINVHHSSTTMVSAMGVKRKKTKENRGPNGK